MSKSDSRIQKERAYPSGRKTPTPLGLQVDSQSSLVDLIPERAQALPSHCVAALVNVVDAMIIT